jgi:hypothetical protein
MPHIHASHVECLSQTSYLRGAVQRQRRVVHLQPALGIPYDNRVVYRNEDHLRFTGALQCDPQNIQEFSCTGAPDLATSIIGESLAGSINHLWPGPLFGVGFSAIGGVLEPPSRYTGADLVAVFICARAVDIAESESIRRLLTKPKI